MTASSESSAADPRAHFDEVLTQELRDRWADNGNTLVDSTERHYDVSGWINGEFDSHIEFVGHDGSAFLATITASTVEDEPRRVRCTLRIRDAKDVSVESVDDLESSSRNAIAGVPGVLGRESR